jgi:hypothetical protein
MSPQMNGEPRDATTAADAAGAASAASKQSASIQGDQPLLEPVNTDGVINTTVTKAVTEEDATLAPLFTPEATADFRSRWDLVQRSFVDNPQEAVHAGDELVAQVITSLAETFSSQRAQLESELDQTDQSSTENLRLALRRYRSFFERLLAI